VGFVSAGIFDPKVLGAVGGALKTGAKKGSELLNAGARKGSEWLTAGLKGVQNGYSRAVSKLKSAGSEIAGAISRASSHVNPKNYGLLDTGMGAKVVGKVGDEPLFSLGGNGGGRRVEETVDTTSPNSSKPKENPPETEGTGEGVRIGSRSVEESLEKINEIRQANNIGGKRNIAFAEYEINGSTGESIGVSGKADRAGTAGVPNQRKFETITTPDGNPRTLDAEVKILEELASQLPNNASGKVHLFSELPFCESCSGVIKQFKEQFPNVDVIISHGPSKSR
jgi:hypothetical protein